MDADYTALTREYYDLTCATALSEQQADRLSQLLDLACQDSAFAVLTHEIESALFGGKTAGNGEADSAKTYADNQIAIIKEFVLKAAPASECEGAQLAATCESPLSQTQTLLDYYQLSTRQHLSKQDIDRIAELLQIAPADVYLNLLKTNLESTTTFQFLPDTPEAKVPNKSASRDRIRDITFQIRSDRDRHLAIQPPESSRQTSRLLTRAGFLITIAATSVLFGTLYRPEYSFNIFGKRQDLNPSTVAKNIALVAKSITVPWANSPRSTHQRSLEYDIKEQMKAQTEIVSYVSAPSVSISAKAYPWTVDSNSQKHLEANGKSLFLKEARKLEKDIILLAKQQDAADKVEFQYPASLLPCKTTNHHSLLSLGLCEDANMTVQEVWDTSYTAELAYLTVTTEPIRETLPDF